MLCLPKPQSLTLKHSTEAQNTTGQFREQRRDFEGRVCTRNCAKRFITPHSGQPCRALCFQTIAGKKNPGTSCVFIVTHSRHCRVHMTIQEALIPNIPSLPAYHQVVLLLCLPLSLYFSISLSLSPHPVCLRVCDCVHACVCVRTYTHACLPL